MKLQTGCGCPIRTMFARLAITLLACVPAPLLAQADLSNSGEFSAYGGGAFGIGAHAAVGGTSAVATRYAFYLLDVSYMPFGKNTLRDYRGQFVAQHSGLYDFSMVSHIRIPLRSPFEPYGILGGGLLHNVYDVPVRTGDIATLSRRSDDNFGFHTGAGVRYYMRPHWGLRGEYRLTISNQTFSRVSAGVFFQLE